MESVKAHFKNAVTLGEDFVDRNPTPCLTKQTKELEDRFGGSRATWFLGVLSVVCIVLYLIGGLGIIANLVGFLYPAYATFKAIDSPDAHASMQWLSYWAIFGLFYVLETPPFSLVLSIIPFYSLLKLGFLIYCFHPYTRGASIAYTKLVSPALAPYLGQAGVGGRVKVSSRVPAATSGAPSKASGGAASASTASTSRGASSVVVPPPDELRSPETNELKVLVVSARNLVETVDPSAQVNCDPYCVLEVVPEPPRPRSGAAESTKYKTVCKASTADPIWNESVIIPQVENLDAKLVVNVANKQALGSDQHLGKVEVPLSDPQLRTPGGADLEMKLSPAPGADGALVSGDLRLIVTLK